MARTPAKAMNTVGNLFSEYLEEENYISGNEALEEGTFIDEKENLVGVAMFVTGWTHRENEQSGLVNVSVEAVVETGERISFADFSSGVRLQLEDITRKLNGLGPNESVPLGKVVPPKPLYFPRGLRVSQYGVKDELEGTIKQAKTFYLDSAK